MSCRPWLLSALAAALLLGGVTPAHAARPDEFTATPLTPPEAMIEAAKTTSGRLADSDADVLARVGGEVVPVMVKIDVDPVASYTGDIAGLAATSPEATAEPLSLDDSGVATYLAYAQARLTDAATAIVTAAPSARVTTTFAVAYGGLALTIAAAEVTALLEVPAVTAVHDDALRQISTEPRASTRDTETVAGDDAALPDLDGRDAAGDGVVVGVIDSGVDPDVVSGIAPDASIGEYRAVGPEGEHSSDLVAATEQAILDDVDVLASSVVQGATSFSDPLQLAFLDAYAAGISVITAGPAGEDTRTDFAPAPWTIAVGDPARSAGVAAVVSATHPDWTPGQVLSALISGSPLAGGENGAHPSETAAAALGADGAVAPTLTTDATAADFARDARDPLRRLDLNTPVIRIDLLPGAAAVTRIVTNVTDRSQVFAARGASADGVALTVAPSAFTLDAGQSQQVTITVDATGAADGWHDAAVTITSTRRGAAALVMPVTVNVGEADLALTQVCAPAEIARQTTTTCSVSVSNFLPVEVDAQITVAANPVLRMDSVSPPADQSLAGASWSGQLRAAAPPTVDSITETTGPSGGYLLLAGLGIDPVPAFGDDSIATFDVTAFRYGGEVYDRLSVGADGFAVVGGTTGGNEAAGTTGIPDREALRNVLAPLWTDLNPAAGGAVRVATVSGGEQTWVVAEWDGVPTFSGNGTNTFQLWLRTGATEGVRFSYGAPAVPDPARGALVGAGNRDGTSTAEAPIPTGPTRYDVALSANAPASTIGFNYTLEGLLAGAWSTSVTLRSSTLATVRSEQTVVTVE